MNEGRAEVLLFDLGGVLMEYTGLRDIHGVLSKELTPEQTRELFGLTADVWSAFERGHLGPETFVARFAEHWPLALPADAFLREFECWVRDLYPGAAALLDSLRPSFRLAALSNTNAVHWRRMTGVLGIDRLFDRAFASHEIGLRKPDAEVYEYVLAALDIRATDVVFFDDTEANVAGAKQVGINAHRVDGVEELRACLSELGYLGA
jgi:putative hydrolase of the HAD superfamily